MSRPLHVILLEDREDDARLILHELRRAGFALRFERIESRRDFLARLDPAPDLILADYHLPQFDALEALELVRLRGLDVPVIVVTGAVGDEAAVECLRRGAADYLLKDRLARLGQSVHLALDQKRHREERRRAERALREAHDELLRANEALVAEIAERARAESELRLAKEDAEAASEAKDRFLATLSHELRTPLNPVLLTVSALLDEPAPSIDLRALLTMIRNNVELEARLIDDLLDVSRVALGKLRLDRELVDLHEVIVRAVETCRNELHAGRFVLALDLSAAERHVYGDPARLQQVFWNLIKNAVKFTPAGGTIAIRSWTSRTCAGRRMVAEVADSGLGIDSEDLARIFRPFEQGDPSFGRRFGGLGLGLSISRSTAEAHGGRLTAESAGRGRGAVFTLELPAAVGPVDGPTAPSRLLASGPTGPPSRILLVDDNQDTLEALAGLLTQRCYLVRTASLLAPALELAASEEFDLVISDIGLPDGDGFELMQQIKRLHGYPGIAISGYGSDEDIRRSREAGFTVHLTKPIRFQDLEAIIRQVASGSDRAPALA